MADQDGSVELGVIEDASDVVSEILDGHTRGIARQRRATVPTVMRMSTVAVVQVMAQMAPDVAVAADSVAQEHRRRMVSLPP
jgi:hypothetical protein